MLRHTTALAAALAATAITWPASAQDHPGHAMSMPEQTPAPTPSQPMDHSPMDHDSEDHGAMDHSSMDHGAMDHASMDHGAMDHPSMDHGGEGSGTARLPANETMNHGAMIGLGGDASLMLHGFAWPVYTSQTGPRAPC